MKYLLPVASAKSFWTNAYLKVRVHRYMAEHFALDGYELGKRQRVRELFAAHHAAGLTKPNPCEHCGSCWKLEGLGRDPADRVGVLLLRSPMFAVQQAMALFAQPDHLQRAVVVDPFDGFAA